MRWTGDGHRFAWRMRLYDRAAQGHFTVRDLATGQRWLVEPEEFLTARQAETMLGRPDMIHQFARHLEAVWAADGYGDVAVHAHIEKSLNGRPSQPYVDPGTDLTLHDLRHLGPDPWVIPLRTALQ